MGHYVVNWPSSTANVRTGLQSLQFILTMIQTTTNILSTGIINPDLMLLDTCSTISSVKNRELIQYICACDSGEELGAYNNEGHQYCSYTSNMMILPFKVFYNEILLAKILSCDAVVRKFRITIDTYLDPSINMHPDDRTSIISNQCSIWIYYYYSTNMKHRIINSQVTDYTFHNTVNNNRVYFHQREIKGADEARILQQLLGWP